MEKKIAIITGLIVCFGLGFFIASIYYSGKPESVNWGRAYVVSEIIGTEVKNPHEEDFGKIKDFVVDTNGRVPFAILAYGEKSVALPFGALKYDREGKHLSLDITRERLDGAPAFDKSALANWKWVEDTYNYFGHVPYWTEERLAEEMSPIENIPSGFPNPE